jgi:hypothetical protein
MNSWEGAKLQLQSMVHSRRAAARRGTPTPSKKGGTRDSLTPLLC